MEEVEEEWEGVWKSFSSGVGRKCLEGVLFGCKIEG